ncbi:MAG: putative exosortase B-associated extracellular polysaccharide biosynthesis transporter EpsL [Pseudomonadota bacterium]|nr:putative exosortase B-associated extracellular polysaccharide biosynthesis transporter EpsL [Pseudomonadota bacterium]
MHSREIVLFPLALLGLMAAGAQADEFDTLQFRAGATVQHDSNVFRLSDSANAQAVIATPSRSDTAAITTVGVLLNKPYSLQRFELDVHVDDYRYRNFSSLDFTAVNYAAAWRWSLTPALHGNLTAQRREFVDNSADVQNLGQLNRRTERANLFDAEYEIDGGFRVLGGVFDRATTNSQPFTFEGDTSVQGAEAGLRYVFPSATSLAYRFKKGRGDYPDRLASAVFPSSFKDREHELRLDWPYSGKTTLQARLSHFDRAHENLSARDFSGVTGQLHATWVATGKTRVTLGLGRELGSYQTGTASYYQGYQFFIAPTWKPSEKTAVRLRYEHGVRDFKGPLPGFAATGRRDKIHLGSLALEWAPIRALKLTLSLQRDKRTSNEPGFDYQSNAVSLGAQVDF